MNMMMTFIMTKNYDHDHDHSNDHDHTHDHINTYQKVIQIPRKKILSKLLGSHLHKL